MLGAQTIGFVVCRTRDGRPGGVCHKAKGWQAGEVAFFKAQFAG